MFTFTQALIRRCALLPITLLLAVASPAQAQRVALLVGNANYPVGKLTNPPNDVAAMEGALKAVGFKVQKVLNANQNQMKRAVRDFGTAAQGAEVAFVYYSGHGTQANGENYLLPVGVSIEKESDYPIEAIAANDVLAQIRGASPKAAILVLDACRDNPLAATTRSTTKGLGRMSAPTGTMIAFATAPGDTASDNGHYAKVLAKELQKPGQELVDVFRNTAAEVRRLSAGGKPQDPRISEMSINERIYLASVAPVPDPDYRPGRQTPQTDPEEEAWAAAKTANSAAAYETYLAEYPRGKFASAARIARAPVSSAVSDNNSSAMANSRQANGSCKDRDYVVQSGDSLPAIGSAFGVHWHDILKINKLENPNKLFVGQSLVIPCPSIEVASVQKQQAAQSNQASSASPQLPISFVWPAAGQVVDPFNSVYRGIGIAGNLGDPVVAAADGRVVYSGFGLRGYGNLIIIRHDNSDLTVYAHNQKLLVIEDQVVKQGQRIAEMGSSDASRVKLHFEIRQNGKPVDPSNLLPAR